MTDAATAARRTADPRFNHRSRVMILYACGTAEVARHAAPSHRSPKRPRHPAATIVNAP